MSSAQAANRNQRKSAQKRYNKHLARELECKTEMAEPFYLYVYLLHKIVVFSVRRVIFECEEA